MSAGSLGVSGASALRLNVTAVAALLAGVAIVFWFRETALAMAALWDSSETYSHGYVVVPLVLWLVWRKRGELADIPVRPAVIPLILMGLPGAAWLLAELAGVASVAHFALVSMVILAVWAILGHALARALAFPLAFLFFAVPTGEFLMPTLMEWTADFVVAALQVSGVPVYRQGLRFQIPTGDWSVVEACSGLRYLTAATMVGCLFAYLNFRSNLRRAAFIALTIAVAIVANWLRGYLIVMLGHLSGNELAAGVDHLIYGWVFFGVVIFATLWVGSRWREDMPEPAAWRAHPFGAERGNFNLNVRVVATAVLALLVASVWKPVLAHLAIPADTPPPVLVAPDGANGWEKIADPITDWTPRFSGQRAEFTQTYARGDERVMLWVGYYRAQREGAELVSSTNQLVTSKDAWFRTAGDLHPTALDGERLTVQQTELARNGTAGLVAWHWYWIHGRPTSSDHLAKLYLALSMVTAHSDDAAAVMVATPRPPSANGASHVLEQFVRDMGGAINERLRVTGETARSAGRSS